MRRQTSIPSMSGSIRSSTISAGRRGLELGERLVAGRGGADGVAGVLEVERDEGRDRALVLDDQDDLVAVRLLTSRSARLGGTCPSVYVGRVAGERLERAAVDRVAPREVGEARTRRERRAAADGADVDPDRVDLDAVEPADHAEADVLAAVHRPSRRRAADRLGPVDDGHLAVGEVEVGDHDVAGVEPAEDPAAGPDDHMPLPLSTTSVPSPAAG